MDQNGKSCRNFKIQSIFFIGYSANNDKMIIARGIFRFTYFVPKLLGTEQQRNSI